MTDARLIDEEGRIAALHRYNLLDTREEEAFEKITQLVQAVLRVPISAVSLIDRDRQWFKSRQGVDARETPVGIGLLVEDGSEPPSIRPDFPHEGHKHQRPQGEDRHVDAAQPHETGVDHAGAAPHRKQRPGYQQ